MSNQHDFETEAETWEKFAPEPAQENSPAPQDADPAITEPDYTGPEIERDPAIEERLDELEKGRA